jgi:hypothetical protein
MVWARTWFVGRWVSLRIVAVVDNLNFRESHKLTAGRHYITTLTEEPSAR